jgi:hypothetical protein
MTWFGVVVDVDVGGVEPGTDAGTELGTCAGTELGFSAGIELGTVAGIVEASADEGWGLFKRGGGPVNKFCLERRNCRLRSWGRNIWTEAGLFGEPLGMTPALESDDESWSSAFTTEFRPDWVMRFWSGPQFDIEPSGAAPKLLMTRERAKALPAMDGLRRWEGRSTAPKLAALTNVKSEEGSPKAKFALTFFPLKRILEKESKELPGGNGAQPILLSPLEARQVTHEGAQVLPGNHIQPHLGLCDQRP